MDNQTDFFQTLAATVREHRKHAGLSQKDLADYAGVGKTAIFDIEHAKPSVQVNTLLKVLVALNIQLELKSPVNNQYD